MPPTSKSVASTTKAEITRWLFSSIAGARNDHTCQRTIGSARSSPASSETLIVVRNGSAGLSVTGFPMSAGSGRLSHVRMCPWIA